LKHITLNFTRLVPTGLTAGGGIHGEHQAAAPTGGAQRGLRHFGQEAIEAGRSGIGD